MFWKNWGVWKCYHVWKRPYQVTRHWFISPLTIFKVNKIRLAGIRHHFLGERRGWIHDAAAFMASWNFMMEGIWQIYDDFAWRDAAKASFYEQWKWMNMNLASLGIIGLLTPSVRKSQIESCFSMTLSPLWVAGLEGTCTWSGVFHLHHHPINTHARPSPAEFMNGTIHLKGISGYLGLRIVIFQTTIVVSEIYNQLLMQQESWYYQAKQCTTRSTSIFQKNLPQKITVQILASSLIPPPPKKKIRLPFHGRQHVMPPGHQPQISGVPKLVEQHPSQGCASSWWPIHLHGGLPGQKTLHASSTLCFSCHFMTY